MRARTIHATAWHIALSVLVFALAWGCGSESDPSEESPSLPRPSAPTVAPPTLDGPAGLIPAFPALPNFRFPVAMLQPPGEPGRWVLLEQEGRVRAFPNRADAGAADTLLDLSARIIGPKHDWESGLLGIAFHPAFPRTPDVFLFYVAHSAASPVGARSVLSRFRMDADGGRIDATSERVLLEIEAGPLLVQRRIPRVWA